MTRKGKYSAEVVKSITDALSTGATDRDAYTHAGIGHDTFHRWLNTKTEFSEAVNRAKTQARLGAVLAVKRAIIGYDTTSTTTESFSETRLRRAKDGTQEPYEYTKTVRKHTVTQIAPDWRAAIEYLKRRDRDNWTDKQIVDMTLTWQAEAKAAGLDPDAVEQSLVEQFEQLIRNGAAAVDTKRLDEGEGAG